MGLSQNPAPVSPMNIELDGSSISARLLALLQASGLGAAIGGDVGGSIDYGVLFVDIANKLAQDPDFLYDYSINELQVGIANGGALRLGTAFGSVGKTIRAPNDGYNRLLIGVPDRIEFTDPNGNNPWAILPTSDFALNRTLTATVGAVTIDKPAGSAIIGAGGSSVVVTNSLVTANSLIFAAIRTNDATAILKNVVPGAGSFTIRTTAAVTADTQIAWWVTN